VSKPVLPGEDYLLQMTIPITFFHNAMAYAILRHNGVDVRKIDFLGPINPGRRLIGLWRPQRLGCLQPHSMRRVT